MNDKLRFGVIGIGTYAVGSLVPQMLESGRATLIAASRRNRQRLQEAQEELGIAQVYADWRELLEHAHPEAVIVATSHDSHAEISIAALDAGVHVFVEKPMALNAKDAWAMVAAADKAGRVLSVGYNARLRPEWQAAKRALEGGAIGTVRQLSASWCIDGRWLWEPIEFPGSDNKNSRSSRETMARAGGAGHGHGQTGQEIGETNEVAENAGGRGCQGGDG